ncbi:hypothetical protein GCM10007989_24190 [Devosia pacifica]|uniref:Uncharacterized protein n=1 Tax=Devosia pacifica TaxID=1335967 RepID=A0A918S8T1_9HYPH|nr:hypothetical protein GCM10007989_24190 [Devosia pacifica]
MSVPETEEDTDLYFLDLIHAVCTGPRHEICQARREAHGKHGPSTARNRKGLERLDLPEKVVRSRYIDIAKTPLQNRFGEGRLILVHANDDNVYSFKRS